MMNCIGGQMFRLRPRIIDAREEDEEAEEYLRFKYSTDEKHASKAQELEDVLNNALSLAERNSGSLLWFQQLSKNNAVEMGRSISQLDISKVRSMEEMPPPPGAESLTTSSSFQSVRSLPTFLKVQRGDPAILTQKSWEAIQPTDTDDDFSTDGDTAEYDYNDNDSFRDVDGTVIRSIHESDPAQLEARSRSWYRLRQSIVQDERASKRRSGGRFRGIGDSIRKVRGGAARDGPELQRSASFAKNSDVEVSLSSGKNRRSWAPRFRRGNKRVPQEEETVSNVESEETSARDTPARSVDVPADEEGGEAFFVNQGNGIFCGQDSVDAMEIVWDPCSSVDMILHGIDTPWQERSVESFDIVPRRQ
jgi:hypothetical protein